MTISMATEIEVDGRYWDSCTLKAAVIESIMENTLQFRVEGKREKNATDRERDSREHFQTPW